MDPVEEFELPEPIMKNQIRLKVNGFEYDLLIDSHRTLLDILREELGLTGTKKGCDGGACGACTVLIDGKGVLSCLILAVECEGKAITTIEGLSNFKTGELDPLQQAFIDKTAFQCGFCTPGLILSAKALLEENPAPTREEVKDALSGNYCRCISHYHVLEAVMEAVRKSR